MFPATRRFRLRRRASAVALLLALLIAGAIYAQSGGASNGNPAAPALLAIGPAGPGHLLRRDGVSATHARHVFALGNGQQLSVASHGKIRCLLRRLRGQLVGEACTGPPTEHGDTARAADTDSAEAERSITVSDECSSTGENRMEITGLAPEGTTTVRLDFTDNSHKTTSVVDGAFRFEGTNPAPGAAYPTGVEWLTNGISEGSAPLPVKGDEFCLPAEEPS
jgi:hypothetical protein